MSTSPSIGAVSPYISIPSGQLQVAQEEQKLIEGLRNLPPNSMQPNRIFKLTEACHDAGDQQYGSDIKYKNICTVEEYSFIGYDIAGNKDDFIEGLLAIPQKETRPYIAIFSQENPQEPIKFTLIKLEPTAQVFDEQTGKFVPLDDSKIEQIRTSLKPEHRIVFFNKTSPTKEAYTPAFFNAQETPDILPPHQLYFHQKQQASEGICGVCSINNSFGKEITNPEELSKFNADYYKKMGFVIAGLPGGSKASPSTLINASEGNDSSTIKEYLVSLAKEGKIDPKYADLILFRSSGAEDIKQMKQQEKHIDRMIIGTSGTGIIAHFIAFRKRTDGRWVKIDSLDSPQTVQSPTEYITELLRRTPTPTVDCIYINPRVLQQKLKEASNKKIHKKALKSVFQPSPTTKGFTKKISVQPPVQVSKKIPRPKYTSRKKFK